MSSVKTSYTKRGYAITKKFYTEDELKKIRKELMVAPFSLDEFNKPEPFPLFLESPSKLYVPKHYGFEKFGEPDEVKVTRGEPINIAFSGQLKPSQLDAFKKYMDSCISEYDPDQRKFSQKSNGGVISVGCGWGKTIYSLKLIAELGRKALVVVHKEFLMNQWKERIAQFMPTARVGTIQGKIVDVENKDIVLCMLQSLSMKEYPDEVFSGFGTAVIDEAHHIAAEVFSRALPKINSFYSIALSATPKRSDGLSKVFHMYLGPFVFRMEKRDDKKIHIHTIRYHDEDKEYNKEELTCTGKLCLPKMINNLAYHSRRNDMIEALVRKLVAEKEAEPRKILILSDRREHLADLYRRCEQFSTVGYYIGGMKQKDLDESATKQVIFGTYPMSSEGLDIGDLNTCIFTTPKTSIEQSVGRIIRKNHAIDPLAFDIVDEFSLFPAQYKKRETVYRKLDYDIYEHDIYADETTSINGFAYQLDQPSKKKEVRKRRTAAAQSCGTETGKVNPITNFYPVTGKIESHTTFQSHNTSASNEADYEMEDEEEKEDWAFRDD
jgi:superfamily II DNA or RNA helicase